MCDGWNTLYKQNCQWRGGGSEGWRSVTTFCPVPKMPLASCYTYSEMMTKHSCQQYTADPCWIPLMRSWPWEIQCGSMRKWIMTSAATRHTVWIYNKTMTIATTKYTVDLWCKCMQVSNIHDSYRNLGGEMISVQSPDVPGSSTSSNLVHFVPCEEMKWR